ncbi:elongation factor G [Porphyromonas miyakawae]|uniref:Elongation factor G n=1 Tax=Porphyromonas miyakawae TaxID=3137470 RepID=A0ABQ0E3F1_9PORP
MKVYKTADIRNISLLGSAGSGKTTLAETMLYEAGVIKRRGEVSQGNTVCDYFPVEKEYGYTVFSTLFSVAWEDEKLNFIDCAGSDDFIGGTVSALNVTDSSLAVVNARYGIEVGLINQLRYVEEKKRPIFFLINQTDDEKADFQATLSQLKERFGGKLVQIQFPVAGSKNQMVDVLSMKMYQWGPEGGTPEVLDIPASELAQAEELRQTLIESAAEHEETLMERFFEAGSLTEEEIVQGMRKGVLTGEMYPVFTACGMKNMGVRRLMSLLALLAPHTTEATPPVTTEGVPVAPDASKPVSLYFFKTTIEPHIGEVSFFKVMQGTLKEGMDLTNSNRDSKERIGQLYVTAGQIRERVDSFEAGDLGATVKLKGVRRGDALNDKDVSYRYPEVEFPNPKYRRSIKAVNASDSEKMTEVLHRMCEEDPTWIVEQSKELRQTIVSGQGEFHLRTLKWRIENNDKIPVEYGEPRIPYRETITKAARADYRHKKQSGGAGQFGEVHLIVEPYEEGKPLPESFRFGSQEFKITPKDTQEIPLDWGGKLVYVNSVVGGAIDARFMPAILKGIMEKMERGPLTGSYARDVRVIVYDGKMHPVDSNEVSFMLAGRNAFSTAFREAAPKVLEPVYDVEVDVPADFIGDVMSDLQGRRAIIMGMNSKKGYEQLLAKVPLKELSNYATALSSLTGGRASFTMKFASYELVPTDVQDKLLKEHEAEEEQDA